jgi:hypothetical protein
MEQQTMDDEADDERQDEHHHDRYPELTAHEVPPLEVGGRPDVI